MQQALPNFLIIGAAKAGTTALYPYLQQHPQIFMSPIKETNYFAYEGPQTKTFLGRELRRGFPVTTMEQYRALFSGVRNEPVIGEASPLYLESPVAAGRIKRALPDAKLCVILRNPVDRAYSDYLMALRLARTTADVNAALSEDSHVVQVGFYYEKLRRYFDLFPRDQIKVCLFDDLSRDALFVVQDIFAYLVVDETFEPDVASRHNVGGVPKNMLLGLILAKLRENEALRSVAPAWVKKLSTVIVKANRRDSVGLPEHLRRRLAALYRDDVLRVQDLIRVDLTRWLSECEPAPKLGSYRDVKLR
jgi:hypothetical protein